MKKERGGNGERRERAKGSASRRRRDYVENLGHVVTYIVFDAQLHCAIPTKSDYARLNLHSDKLVIFATGKTRRRTRARIVWNIAAKSSGSLVRINLGIVG